MLTRLQEFQLLVIMTRPRIAVIGAGISGLSTANLLSQSPYKPIVTLLADKFSPNTTTDLAAAIIWPVEGNIGSSDTRKQEWAKVTFRYLYDLFSSPLSAGLNISLIPVYRMFDANREDPWWKDCVLGFRHVEASEIALLHYPMTSTCWSFNTLIMQCGPFLSWQMEQFRANGGNVMEKRLRSLEEIDGQYDIVVNCTGLGSRELVNDDQMYPVRGQTIIVKAPWVKHAFSYTKDDTHVDILPRANDVLLGSTEDIGDWSEHVDPVISKEIMERCCKYVPGLSTAPVVREAVGLRPGRKTVRLEVDDTITKHSTVIHNYGHGGQGVTFFRGCSLDAVKLVEECLMRRGFIHNHS